MIFTAGPVLCGQTVPFTLSLEISALASKAHVAEVEIVPRHSASLIDVFANCRQGNLQTLITKTLG